MKFFQVLVAKSKYLVFSCTLLYLMDLNFASILDVCFYKT